MTPTQPQPQPQPQVHTRKGITLAPAAVELYVAAADAYELMHDLSSAVAHLRYAVRLTEGVFGVWCFVWVGVYVCGREGAHLRYAVRLAEGVLGVCFM